MRIVCQCSIIANYYYLHYTLFFRQAGAAVYAVVSRQIRKICSIYAIQRQVLEKQEDNVAIDIMDTVLIQ